MQPLSHQRIQSRLLIEPAAGAAVLFPLFIGLQLIPLPLLALKIIDPTRVEIAKAVQHLSPTLGWAPVSIAPDKTWFSLSVVAGCAMVFFLIREAACRANDSWAPAVPLIMLGGVEAAWGLVQGPHSVNVLGISDNKDHFSGQLEIILPLALMFGVALLFRHRERGSLAASSVLRASAVFAVAAIIFSAIVSALSKMGFVSMLASLLLMGALFAGAAVSGRKKWAAIGAVVVLALMVFIFLPPDALVNAFGEASTDPTAENRIPIWRDTLRLAGAYPLFGSGFGTYYPALIRYQTAAPNLAWIHAHNDYVELLSNLGIVGFLILVALMGSVLILAVRIATSSPTLERRCLGLACTGSLAAMLIHGLADFNMYIPANALTLSWVAGISAASPGEERRNQRKHLAPTPRFIRGVLFAIGCFASLYAGLWLVYLDRFHENPRIERLFCRFGVCDDNGALAGLRKQYSGSTGSVPPAEMIEFLRRDPAGPYHWLEMGRSLQRAGRTEEAGYCFTRMLALGPRTPSMLFQAAVFRFSVGERSDAVNLVNRAIEGDGGYAGAAFDEYEEQKIPVQEVVRHGLPPDATLWRSYLGRQIAKKRVAEAMTVWSWLVPLGYANDETTNRFVGFLTNQKKLDAAVQAWALAAGSRSKAYPGADHVFNGDFEYDPWPQPVFDWWIDNTPGVVIDFDSQTRHSGARSLRVQFDGTQNVTGAGLHQSVVLKPGKYKFMAWVRTKDISTDEGVALSLVGQDGPGPNVTTEALLGSTDWKLVESRFVAPPGTGLMLIGLTRKQSLKFDNLLRGTLWIDQVSIRPEPY